MKQILPQLSAISTTRTRDIVTRAKRWLLPAVAIAILLALGWWTRRTLENSLKQDKAQELVTILKADVAALSVWFDSQKSVARSLAVDRVVQQNVIALVELARQDPEDEVLRDSEPLARLRERLNPICNEFGYEGFVVVDFSGRTVAASADELVGPRTWRKQSDFVDRALEGEVVVCKPFIPEAAATDAQDGEAANRRALMFVAAGVENDSNQIIAALGFQIRPEDDFTRILTVARSGETGETYAFDSAGRMISDSRFDDDLKQIGLIPAAADATAVLNVQVRDPGGNMVTGFRPKGPRTGLPLTYMAASAVDAGRSGDDSIEFNVEGYNDYRGVPVVGAWQWLPQYDFGVTTEVDVAEAFRPAFILRAIVWGLFGLVTVGTVAVLVFTRSVDRLQRRVRSANAQVEELGQYALMEKLGEGGMGEVYRAEHAMLRRPTAVKLLRPERSSEQAVARFEREVQLTSQLTHPNTIAVYDYGRTPEGVFYYAMEYLDGVGLDELVRAEGTQPESRVIHILEQACGSLDEAHDLGLIHRDIKPANIMLCRRGRMRDVVKVLDFGLVKDVQESGQTELTTAGALTGTPLYMSPEAVEHRGELDARSDIYSLGAVGYYLLTGQHVFEGDSPVKVCFQHVHAEPVPPSQRAGREIAADLEQVILACLSKQREDRPQSAAELAEQLASCADSGGWSQAEAIRRWEVFERVQPATQAEASTSTDSKGYDQTVDFGQRKESTQR